MELHNQELDAACSCYRTERETYVYQSPGGEVQFCASQGKVDLSELGNPEKLWVVFQVLESTRIKAPQNSYAYVDVKNKLGIAFLVQKRIEVPQHPGTAYPHTQPEVWMINLPETANATLILKNYGNRSIELSAQLELPSDIDILNGETFWNVTLAPSEKKELTTSMGGDNFGIYQFYIFFFYDGMEDEPFKLPQKLAVVPTVEVSLQAPQETYFMQLYEVNLTVRNKDSVPATITLVPALGASGNPISLTLNSSATITIRPNVVIEGVNVAYDAKFQNIPLARSIVTVNMLYPQITIVDIAINSIPYHYEYFKMSIDEIYEIRIKLRNAENFSYTATLNLEVEFGFGQSIATSEYFMTNKSSETVTLAPQLNKTIAFRILPLNADGSRYRTLILRVMVGDHTCSTDEIMLEVTPSTLPWYSPLFMPQTIISILIIFAIGIITGIIILKAHFRKLNRTRHT